jgi:hypothetical protein
MSLNPVTSFMFFPHPGAAPAKNGAYHSRFDVPRT